MEFRRRLINFIVAANLPARVVDLPELHELLEYLNDEVDVPGRTAIQKYIKEAFDTVTETLLDGWNGESRISLATDMWSSPNHMSFMGVRAYFISKLWTYESALVGFLPVYGKHSGENMASELYQLVDRLGIAGSIFCLATDNATNNTTLAQSFERILLTNKGVVWDYNINLIPCMAHVLQLGINEFLGAIRSTPTNDSPVVFYDEESYIEGALSGAQSSASAMATLINKVCICLYLHNTGTYCCRSVRLSSKSTPPRKTHSSSESCKLKMDRHRWYLFRT